ncbi:lactosylceramide 1,3-N-acetyl-beta-D-glucosaminyltransferase B-like [Ylistrum balloti]|uniref:lactosylceramide 1,3-N-acetyl-beta-D-glucosaminyltransferase B-like n=1 Tax=Ylistrum balloti TaxID=509963 RepID=UPI002905BDBC|nr:lactosylceramide 1,3-N-acetyl-beta-D-glucosaminyltransferase B-like [Ylistrum balloti]
MTFVNINRKAILIPSMMIFTYYVVRMFTPAAPPPDPPDLNFTINFSYPLDTDMERLVSDYRKGYIINEEIVNPFPYEFIKNPSNKCTLTEAEVKVQNMVFILFMVKSAYENHELRNVIRQTWGNEKYLTHFNIKTVFTVGVPKDRSKFNLIKNESDQMKDIVQVDHIDTYYNNTIKMMAEFNWVVKFCRNARYVILIDDDYFVSPEALVTMLEHSSEVRNTKRLYMGNKKTQSKPRRDKRSKWHVPYSEYPYDIYPDFINAGTIIMSMDFVIDAQIAMMYTKLFRLDDIFLSIVARKLNVPALGTERVFSISVMPWDRLNFEFLVTAHHYKVPDLQWLWRRHGRRRNSNIRPRYTGSNT